MAANLLRETRARTRGGLVKLPMNPGGQDFFLIPFLFNPTEYTEDDGQQYAKNTIPMWPDVALQYVGGTGATFKFDVIMEQERLWEFFNQAIPGNLPASLESYLALIETLKFPSFSEPGNVYLAAPPRVMVIFGTFFRIGYIEKTSIKYKDFFTNGNLRSVEMQVSMLLAHGRARQYQRQANESGSILVPASRSRGGA